jgi:protocatechuate 4,5-dioxygenase beta chain
MPLEFGLASSHAGFMFAPLDKWPIRYEVLTSHVPQPPQAAAEDAAVQQEHKQRIASAMATLSRALEAYRPDAVLIVGDDQDELFSAGFSPSFAIYTGDTVSGSLSLRTIGESMADNVQAFPCHGGLARALRDGLVREGFDLTWLDRLDAVAPRREGGIGHAFSRPAKTLRLPDLGIPIIPFFLNAYHRPLPTASRCYALGQAMRRVLAARPERLAIYASGGLSHDPGGPRSGWIDQPLDRWVLDRLAAGETEQLTDLFTFDSDTLESGTGEIRCWIVAAGAMAQRRATVVDYIPSYHAVTGLGFAYWPTDTAGGATTTGAGG